jgi:acylphosphatase
MCWTRSRAAASAVAEERTRVRLVISGRVQGVFFRESTRQVAERLEIGGWVRNVPGGRVEAVFEGPTAAVAKATAWCRSGPPGAVVQHVESRPEQPTGETGFRVLATRFGI